MKRNKDYSHSELAAIFGEENAEAVRARLNADDDDDRQSDSGFDRLIKGLDRVEALQRRSKSGRSLSGPALRIAVKALAAGDEPPDPEELLKQLTQALQLGDYAGAVALCDELKAYASALQDASERTADMRGQRDGRGMGGGRVEMTGDTPVPTGKARRTSKSGRTSKSDDTEPLFPGLPNSARITKDRKPRETSKGNVETWFGFLKVRR